MNNIELNKKFEILKKKFQAGLFEEVINGAKSTLKQRKHQVLYNIICLSYQNLGKFNEAIKIMELGLLHNPKNTHFLNNIGVSYYNQQNYTKANYYFIRGLTENPNHISILNNLGNLYRDLNSTNEAIKYYNKCIEINDSLIQPLFNLSLCYESLGEFEKAKDILNKILKLNPGFTEVDRILSTMTKYKKNNAHFLKIKDKIKDNSLSKNQLRHLHFAIAKYYEDIGDIEKSFENYFKANEYSKKLTNYNINDDKKFFEKIKLFNLDNFPNESTNNNRKIIFIVGMPRSGTSLIEQILSSHKNVFGGGELNFLNKIVNKNFFKKKEIEKFDEYKKIEILLDSNKEYMDNISLLDNSNNAFVDKAPLNFKYIGFIKKIFPNSKVINCKRDPIDVGWSIFKNHFMAGSYFSNSFEDIGKFYKLYKDILDYWENHTPSFIYNIEYKNLVEKPEDQIKKLLKYCDLDWDENCLIHHKNTNSIKTVSSTQARKPIYQSSLNNSKIFDHYLDDLKKFIN
ncbi:TPR subfamily 2 repeat-containing sulfotransferase domain protein [alpha proteobacterium HIMB5]|nr:TPR subfamily 2 repeat-containing sulfotransferase domain protein [alpha proteobacterium HIMB5]